MPPFCFSGGFGSPFFGRRRGPSSVAGARPGAKSWASWSMRTVLACAVNSMPRLSRVASRTGVLLNIFFLGMLLLWLAVESQMLSIRSYIYYGLGRRAVMASEATNGHVSHPRSDGVDGSGHQ